MITVLALLSRPEMALNLRGSWLGQIDPERRLIVIENGKGIGACDSVDLFPDVLAQGPSDVVELRNFALECLLRCGGGLFSFWDDDDYYGPEYLSEAEQAISEGAFVGKIDRFVRTRNGLWLLTGICENESCTSKLVSTNTLCGQAEDAVPFRRNSFAWGEDTLWCQDMIARGYRCTVTSRYNFAYTRGSPEKHLWPIETDGWARAWCSFGGRVLDAGQWDPEIVNGTRLHGEFELQFEEWSPLDDPSVKAAVARCC